jgi:hypothetical protein
MCSSSFEHPNRRLRGAIRLWNVRTERLLPTGSLEAGTPAPAIGVASGGDPTWYPAPSRAKSESPRQGSARTVWRSGVPIVVPSLLAQPELKDGAVPRAEVEEWPFAAIPSAATFLLGPTCRQLRPLSALMKMPRDVPA